MSSEQRNDYAPVFVGLLIFFACIAIAGGHVATRIKQEKEAEARTAAYAAAAKKKQQCWASLSDNQVAYLCSRSTRIVNRRWKPRQYRYRPDSIAQAGHHFYEVCARSSCGTICNRVGERAEQPNNCTGPVIDVEAFY